MKETKIEYGQTQLDVALQELGDLGRLFEVANANGKSITDELEAGSTIQVPEYEADKRRVVSVFTNAANKPASGITTITGEPEPEGIEYWGIEIDFIVS